MLVCGRKLTLITWVVLLTQIHCLLTLHITRPEITIKLIKRDLRGIEVYIDERSNFRGCHGKLVCYLHWRKHLCCRSKYGAGIPRGGPKVNFPHRTLNKFRSFMLSVLRHQSQILYFLFETLIIRVCWQIFINFYRKRNVWKKNQKLYFSKKWGKIQI